MLFYFFLGLVSSIIGAIPLGATNVVVINTTLKTTLTEARKILYPAAFGEVILVVVALYASMPLKDFIQNNSWFHLLIPVIMILIGGILLYNKKSVNYKKIKFTISKPVLGFSTALLNPPVLIYWIFVLSFLNKQMITITFNSAYLLLVSFIIGVFAGKVVTLLAYGKSSVYLKPRLSGVQSRINHIIGLFLITIAIFQILKIFLS